MRLANLPKCFHKGRHRASGDSNKVRLVGRVTRRVIIPLARDHYPEPGRRRWIIPPPPPRNALGEPAEVFSQRSAPSLWRFEQGSTGGARYAQGYNPAGAGSLSRARAKALDNPTPSATKCAWRTCRSVFTKVGTEPLEIRTRFDWWGALRAGL